MDIETWKTIWQFVFFAASILFYVTVAVVAFKGFRDVAAMIGKMWSDR